MEIEAIIKIKVDLKEWENFCENSVKEHEVDGEERLRQMVLVDNIRHQNRDKWWKR